MKKLLALLLVLPLFAEAAPRQVPAGFIDYTHTDAVTQSAQTGHTHCYVKTDGLQYCRNSAGTESAVGNVLGLGTPTQYALPMYNDTTGKVVTPSPILYRDAANIHLPTGDFFTDTGYGYYFGDYGDIEWGLGIDLITSPNISGNAASIVYDDAGTHGFAVGPAGGTPALEIDGNKKVWLSAAFQVSGSARIEGVITAPAGVAGNASTATALAANPTDCAAGQVATQSAANGDLTCVALTPSYLPAPEASAITGTDIDWSILRKQGGVYTKTLGANTTFTFSNLAVGIIIVRLTNTASNYTVTWPTVKWSGGAAPVMSIGAVSDVYTFVYDGTDVHGSVVQETY